MRVKDFPRTVGNLSRRNVKWVDGRIDALDYGLSGEDMLIEKYLPLRDTVFTLRVLSPEQFRVLIDGEAFDDAFSPEHIPIVLSAAFDHASIQSGIVTSAKKFKNTGQEENLVRRRHSSRSTAFDKFRTAEGEDAVFSKRAEAPSTAFDKFRTAGGEDAVFGKRAEAPSTAFDRFKSSDDE